MDFCIWSIFFSYSTLTFTTFSNKQQHVLIVLIHVFCSYHGELCDEQNSINRTGYSQFCIINSTPLYRIIHHQFEWVRVWNNEAKVKFKLELQWREVCGGENLYMSVGDGEVYEWVWPKGIGEVRSGEGENLKKEKIWDLWRKSSIIYNI